MGQREISALTTCSTAFFLGVNAQWSGWWIAAQLIVSAKRRTRMPDAGLLDWSEKKRVAWKDKNTPLSID